MCIGRIQHRLTGKTFAIKCKYSNVEYVRSLNIYKESFIHGIHFTTIESLLVLFVRFDGFMCVRVFLCGCAVLGASVLNLAFYMPLKIR